MGIELLQSGHWEEQYSLSLDLFEMSASLCYMLGDTAKMSDCLDELLAHSKSFEDSLNASAMLARLLTRGEIDDQTAISEYNRICSNRMCNKGLLQDAAEFLSEIENDKEMQRGKSEKMT